MVKHIEVFVIAGLGEAPTSYRAVIRGIDHKGNPFVWEDADTDRSVLLSSVESALNTNAIQWGISTEPA